MQTADLFVATPVLIAAGAVLAVGGASMAYRGRVQEQQQLGMKPAVMPTLGVAVLDVLGVAPLWEGYRRERLLPGMGLDDETAGELMGAGVVGIAAWMAGPKLGRALQLRAEPYAARVNPWIWGRPAKASAGNSLEVPTRAPILADTNLLIAAAEKGHAAAIAEIRASQTLLTPNQYREFLNVGSTAQRNARRAFLARENGQVLTGSEAAMLAQTPEFQSVSQAIARVQGRGGASRQRLQGWQGMDS